MLRHTLIDFVLNLRANWLDSRVNCANSRAN